MSKTPKKAIWRSGGNVECLIPSSAAGRKAVRDARRAYRQRMKGRRVSRVVGTDRADPRLGITHRMRTIPAGVYFVVASIGASAVGVATVDRASGKLTGPVLTVTRAAYDSALALSEVAPRGVVRNADGAIGYVTPQQWRRLRHRLANPVTVTVRRDPQPTGELPPAPVVVAPAVPQDRRTAKLRALPPQRFTSFMALAEALV